MIKLVSLQLENFMNINKCSLDLDKQIIIITGRSGQGKSAVFDAIALCLSSKKRSSTYSEYVKQGATHAKVELHCIINNEPIFFNLQINLAKGTPYQMEMHYKDEIYKNTDAENLLSSFDIEYFNDIIFSMQSDDQRDITQLSPTVRSTYLQRLLNFDFQKQKEEITNKIILSKEQQHILENDNILKTSLIENEEKNIETIKEIILSEKDIHLIQEDIKDKQKKIDDNQLNQNKIKKLNEEIAFINKDIVSLNISKNSLISKINEFDKLQNSIEENKKNKIENINKIKKIEEDLIILDKNFKSNTEDFEKLYILISKKEADLKVLEDYEQQYAKNLQLFEQKKCPVCGQLTEELAKEQLDNINNSYLIFKDIAFINNTLDLQTKDYPLILKRFKESIEEVTQEKNKLNKELEENKNSNNKIYRNKAINEGNLENLEKEKIKIEEEFKLYEKKLNDNFDYSLELEKVNKSINEKNEKIKLIEKNIEEIHIDDISLLSKELVELTNKLNSYFNDIKLNNEIKIRNEKRLKFIENNKKIIEENNIKIKNIIIQNNIYDEVYVILDKTLPNYMIVKTCASLQSEMNGIIQTIFPLYEVKLINSKKGTEFFYTKDNTIIETKKRNNAWINSKMSSGFEKALLTLAFKISLAQLYGLNIIIGDEIDGAADDESSEKFFELLLANSSFDQVFLISHKKSVCQLIMDNSSDFIAYNVDNGRFNTIDFID